MQCKLMKWAGLGLLTTSLLACSTFPTLYKIAPDPIKFGQENEVTVTFDRDVSGSTLALQPSGAEELDSLMLHQPATGLITLSGQRTLIALGQDLQVWRTNVIDHVEIVGNYKFEGMIRQMVSSDGRVLVVLDDGQVQLLQLNIDQPELVKSYTPEFDIRQIALSADAAYLLDQTNRLHVEKFVLGESYSANAALSFRSSAMACQLNYCYFATEQGLRTVSLEPTGVARELPLYPVAGAISDLKRVDNRLYLAGEMGLTILSIDDPEQPRWLGSNNKFGPAQRLAVSENMVLLEDGNGRMIVVDSVSPEQPFWMSSFRPEEPLTYFAVEGGEALLASQFNLQRLQLANMSMPAMNSSGINLGGSRRVAVRDNKLYVADWFSGLHIYDISDPITLRHTGNVHTPGSAKGVLLDGDYAYVGDDDHGLQIIDLKSMKIVHQVPTTGLAYTMQKQGNLLYLADHRGGFHIIDIKQPEKAYIVGSYDTPGKVWSLQLYQHYVYATDDKTGVLIFDVKDPSQPKLVGQYAPGGFAEDVVIRDHYAYVAFFDDGFHILDISNPVKPIALGYLPTPGNARGIELVGDLAYLADWDAGIQIIDIADPKQPRWLSGLDTRGAAWGVTVVGKYAYVMDWWGGIQVVDVSDIYQPKRVSGYHLRDTLHDIALVENYAYVAKGKAGLQVFDVKNSQGPIWVTGLELQGDARQLVVDAGRAFIATGEGGVAIVDISDPFYARLLNQTQQVGVVKRLAVWQQTLFTLSDQGVLNLWQIGVKGKLTHLSASGDEFRDLWAYQGKLVLALAEGGLQILDVKRLQMQSRLPTGTIILQAVIQDGRLYTLDDEATVSFWQLEGDSIKHLSHYRLDEPVASMALLGDQLFINGEKQALYVVDISEIRQPVLKYRYPRADVAGKIAVNGEAVFSAGSDVLMTLKQLPSFEQRSAAAPDQVVLSLPKEMPMGDYDLIMTDQKRESMDYPHALTVAMPKGRRSTFSMEDLKKALKEHQVMPTQAK